RKEGRKILLFAAFSFAILFFISPDSYIRGIYGHLDSAWFFEAGRAWMLGLTPYVDFADSKGPLLWLIYGMGYLISHQDYTGVFWMSVVFYTAAFYFNYRAALVLTKNSHQSIVASLLMALFYFFPLFHYEIRAEDFCQPFMSISFWALCVISQGSSNTRQLKQALLALGGATAALLLIKFNYAAMQLSIVLCAAITTLRQRRDFAKSFVHYLSGVLIVLLPFV
ncbi:MAG: glycosyltransferase family 39 protein, partial [Muribaculaceae bacterium]|nr:glycosyltransferase family 39 protein [Muribaculaceae bacterium]